MRFSGRLRLIPSLLVFSVLQILMKNVCKIYNLSKPDNVEEIRVMLLDDMQTLSMKI